MKKNIVIIICLIAGLGYATAQTVTSQEVAFDTVLAEDIIVRAINNGNGNNIIYYRNVSSNRHYLAYHLTNANSFPYLTTSFLWPLPSPDATYKVNDMAVLNDGCYFCGSYTNGGITYGLVGRIGLSLISTGTIDFAFIGVPQINEFKRMDVTKGTNDHIALIGNSTNVPSLSAVAFVTWDGSQWACNRYMLNDDGETFTDIAFTANGEKVVAVSRYLNEPYRFYLRGELTATAFNSYPYNLPNFNQRNTFYTYGLTIQSSTNPGLTWHRNDVEMRLVTDLPENEEVTVAYECFDSSRECEPTLQVAMFKVDLSNFPGNNYEMDILDKQIVRGNFNQPNAFMDIKYVENDESIALLHSCRNCPKEISTLVQFPTWNNFGNIEALQTEPQYYTSMDIRGTKHICLAGVDPADNHLLHFSQYKPELDNSCYLSRPMSQSEQLIGTLLPNLEDRSTELFHMTRPHFYVYPLNLNNRTILNCQTQ